MAGLPGVSVPCGLSEGLPVGLQLIGAAWSEDVAVPRRPGLRGRHRRRGLAADRARTTSRAPRGPVDAVTPARAHRRGRLSRVTATPMPYFAHDRRRPPTRAPLAERALASACAPCRRRASGASSTSSRRWTTSSASGWGSRTSTRRARSSRRASRACARAAPTTRATSARSSCAARSRTTWSSCTASATTPENEILVTVGASEAVDLALRATCDPGDEVILHEPSYVAYVPAIVFAGGTPVRVADPVRGRLRARPRRRRGGDHAAHQGAVPRLPGEPDRRRARRRRPGRARADRRRPRPARVQRRDLRPARVRHVPPPARSARCPGCASGRSSWAASRRPTR